MTFTGMPTRAYQYNQKGAELKSCFQRRAWCCCRRHVHPEGGPHPNAKLWIDFILSERGQMHRERPRR